jgi:uncharacterized protein (TIRG00374 family)
MKVKFSQKQTLEILLLLLKVGISAGLIWYLIGKISGANLLSYIQILSPWVLAISLLLIIIQSVLAALRWTIVISSIGQKLPFSKSVVITFVSLFFNQFLPASIGGDAVRIWQSKKSGLSLNKAITSVVLERLLTLLSIAGLSVIMFPILSDYYPNKLILLSSLLIVFAVLICISILIFCDRLPTKWNQWRLIRGMIELSTNTKKLVFKPWSLINIIISIILGQLLLAAATQQLAQGIGVEIRFIYFVAIMPTVVLISSLPISIAGWGLREFAMVTGLGIIGVSPDAAVATSILLALSATLASLPGGALIMLSRIKRK